MNKEILKKLIHCWGWCKYIEITRDITFGIPTKFPLEMHLAVLRNAAWIFLSRYKQSAIKFTVWRSCLIRAIYCRGKNWQALFPPEKIAVGMKSFHATDIRG